MERNASAGLPRRTLLRVLAATAVVAAPNFANAFSYVRGAGDIRRLNINSGRTSEALNIVYWADGEYIPEALVHIDYFFRDWHKDKVHRIDTRLLDIMVAAHRLLDTDEPYNLLSGYRSPQTTQRSGMSGAASDPPHTLGQAADVRMHSRSVAQVAQAAATCRAGGVGCYLPSNFTHIDCGPIREWAA